MARPQAFERELRLATAGLEPQQIQKQLAAFARKSLLDAQRAGEAPEEYVRYVNGRRGASEDTVQVPGPIVYEFSWLSDVIEYALSFARARSPKRSGRYMRSWFVMINGRETKNFEAIPPNAEVILTNDVPYARKIEVGAMRMRVPPGVVEDTRQAVARRFGNTVRVERKFINLSGGYVLKRGRKAGTPITYPAVVITQRL